MIGEISVQPYLYDLTISFVINKPHNTITNDPVKLVQTDVSEQKEMDFLEENAVVSLREQQFDTM